LEEPDIKLSRTVLEQELILVQRREQELLSQLKKTRQDSREQEKFKLFKQEAIDILWQFVFNVWEKQLGRHFDLSHIFEGTGYNRRNSLKEINDNELEMAFPVFFDDANPGRFKLDRLHFWILPSLNQEMIDRMLAKKRIETANSIFGDMQRTAGTTYVFLAPKGSYDKEKCSEQPNHDFVFSAIKKSAKFMLTRLFRILKNRLLARLRTMWFKLRMTEKTDLRNPSNHASWSNLRQICEYNAALIQFSGPPLELSFGMERIILSQMRLACECENFEAHSEETERIEGEHDMFTMANTNTIVNIVNIEASFATFLRRESPEFDDPRWKRDKDGIILADQVRKYCSYPVSYGVQGDPAAPTSF
jgi:hypothetical protein